jgi:sporulation related protein
MRVECFVGCSLAWFLLRAAEESNLMAENDQRSYRDPSRWRSAEEAPRAQADDPLAELARLIGQSVPMNKLSRDRRPAPETADDRRGQVSQAASYPAPDEVLREAADDRYSTPEVEQHVQDADPDYRAVRDDRHERAARAHPAPPSRGSRFRQEPDFVVEPARDVADGEAHEAAHQETADWHDQSSDERDRHYQGEYEDEQYAADDHGYGDEYGEEQNTGRRGGFIFVVAVFALALLGTAGAFAYRAMFGGPVLPALPPIIKAETGPNKIAPSGVGSQDSAARDANDNKAASRERLVSREERPVNIPQPVTSTAPRSVSTVPVFPDPPSIGGPGAVVGYSAGPSSSNPAMSTPPPAPPAPAMPATTASNPNAGQASPPAATPSVSTVAPATPGMPAAPGPKKIRTVTIHTDQSSALDGTAGSSVSQAVAPRPGTQSPQGSNAPLSIVPSPPEAPAAAAPVRPRPAPAQPVPPSKPPANETASAAPAVPVATGGGYAVQISSQRSEEEAQSSFRDLQAKYPDLLGGRTPIIRRADLGAKGIFFRAMVGPFTSADQATELCSNLKAAGGSCLVQKN